jgi:hypothetical protein
MKTAIHAVWFPLGRHVALCHYYEHTTDSNTNSPNYSFLTVRHVPSMDLYLTNRANVQNTSFFSADGQVLYLTNLTI